MIKPIVKNGPLKAPSLQSTGFASSPHEEAKTSPAKKSRGKMIGTTAPKSQAPQPSGGAGAINQELEALAQLRVLLIQLTNQLSQGQLNMSKAMTQATIEASNKMIDKIHQAEKAEEEAKKKHRSRNIFGIVVAVFTCALAAATGIEALAAVSVMMILQYSKALDKMTDGMSDQDKTLVSLAIGLALGLLTAGIGGLAFSGDAAAEAAAEGAAEGAGEGAAEEVLENRTFFQRLSALFKQNKPTTAMEAAGQGARFGMVTGAMGALMSTGVIEKEMQKLCGNDQKGAIISMLLLLTIAIMTVAAAGCPSSSGEIGILGQMEEGAAGMEASAESTFIRGLMQVIRASVKTLKTATKAGTPLLTTGLTAASIGEGTTQIQIGEINKKQAEISKAMATIQKTLAQLRLPPQMLKILQNTLESNFKSYSEDFQKSLENLQSTSLGWEALNRVLRARSA